MRLKFSPHGKGKDRSWRAGLDVTARGGAEPDPQRNGCGSRRNKADELRSISVESAGEPWLRQIHRGEITVPLLDRQRASHDRSISSQDQ